MEARIKALHIVDAARVQAWRLDAAALRNQYQGLAEEPLPAALRATEAK